MSTNIYDFSLDLDNLTDTQYKKVFASIPHTKADGEKPSVIDVDALVDHICDALNPEGGYGDAVKYISIGSLLDNIKDTPVQVDINPNKVCDVIAGEYGIYRGHTLIKPPTIMIDEDGKMLITGGRHRLSAIITPLVAADLDEELIEQIEIPYIPMRYDPRYVIADNTSRGATKDEKVRYFLSAEGIDVSDPGSIVKSYVEQKIPGVPSTQLSKVLRALIVVSTEDVDDVTTNTKGDIIAGLFSSFKKINPDVAKRLVVGKNLDVQFLVDFVDFVSDNLKQVIDWATTEGGVTNLARDYKTLVNRLYVLLQQEIKSGNFKLPEAVESPSKKKKEAAPKPSEDAKQKKPRTKKSNAGKTVVPEATVPASDDVKVVVSQ